MQLPIARVRTIAISATIPNIQDIAEWLDVPPGAVMEFGEELRPVKLNTIVRGYAAGKNEYLFERRLSDYILNVITEHSQAKPSLVFCRQAGLAHSASVTA